MVVLKGVFHHNLNLDGLSMHAGNTIEMQEMSHFVELPPALSFNIVFQGQVDFSVGNHDYQLGNHFPVPVECSAIIVNRPEVMIRHFKKGMHVCKLNLLAERQWLEKRAKTTDEKQRLAGLFANHNVFRCWQPSAPLIRLAQKLLKHDSELSLANRLKAESLTLALLARCIDEMVRHSHLVEPDKSAHVTSRRDKQLKQQLDKMIMKPLSLQEIAHSLGMSTSTLQRKFKAAYGVTVNSYCRQRRLDMARNALLVEGKTIGEVAYLAGYRHPSNFIAAFKKRYQQTPSELLSRHRH